MFTFGPFPLPVVGTVASAKMVGAAIEFWSRPFQVATGLYGVAVMDMMMAAFKKNEERKSDSSGTFSAF